jgi:hypothetical protein
MILCPAAKEDLEFLSQNFSLTYREEPDWFDYMYRVSDLATLAGKKYNGQRNHINHFLRTYEHRLEKIGKDNIKDALALVNRLDVDLEYKTPTYLEERAKSIEVLQNFELYGQTGLVLYAGGEAVAFSVGEIIGDTLFVHIEKADTSYRGAPQMIASRFVQFMASDSLAYVNREEDLGDEGLRKSKLSYHPVKILEKYSVFVEL